MPFIDADGNEIPVTVVWSCGWEIRDQAVHHFHEEGGEREEWTEPLYDSPVREAFPEWVWDAALDPRL